MANKLLDKHTRLTKQIEILEAEIAGAATGIDKKEKDFNYQQWVRKWRVSKSADLKEVLKESKSGKGKSLRIGSVGKYFTDPKKLLNQLKEQQTFYERNLGKKYSKDMDFVPGITSGKTSLRTNLLNTVNPFYDRKFDKEVFYKERELAIQAQNKFKEENKGTWHETYDDPIKGWRQFLPDIHSEKPGSPNASPTNPDLKVTPSQHDNVTNGNRTTLSTGGYKEGDLKPNEVTFGTQQWVGRGTDVLTAEGGSTSLSIARRDWGGYKKGDLLGVMSKSKRRKYDREVLQIGK